MELFFAGDSTHKGIRDGMGKIIAFGGVFVSPEALMPLEQQITDICQNKYGIPEGEEIKWSPNKKTWIYENLHGENRTECYREILQAEDNADSHILRIETVSGRGFGSECRFHLLRGVQRAVLIRRLPALRFSGSLKLARRP